MKNNKETIKKLKHITGDKNILTANWSKVPYSEGWRYGSGKALAVAKPGTLLEIWDILKVCVDNNIIYDSITSRSVFDNVKKGS